MGKKRKSVYLRGERNRVGYVKEVHDPELGKMYGAYDYRDTHLGDYDTPEDAADTVTEWFGE